MTTGVLSAIAGSQSELTAGELLGITRPSAWHVGKNESFVRNCSPKPVSRSERASPRERPLSLCRGGGREGGGRSCETEHPTSNVQRRTEIVKRRTPTGIGCPQPI